jgi:hypothetical protein
VRVICQRCGREQPTLFSPCPECLVGSVSSISREAGEVPLFLSGPHVEHASWGGDTEPTRSASLIKDPDLRAAFLRAYTAWERAS